MSATGVLVIGGTGKTGLLTVKDLLSRQEEAASAGNPFTITVAYRSEEKFQRLFDQDVGSLSKLPIDLADFDSYPKSLSNYDVVIFTHGAVQWVSLTRLIRSFFYAFWPQHAYYTEFQSMIRFVEIAKQTNPNIKFIVMSSLGTLNPFWTPALFLNTLFCGVVKYKYLLNQYLRQSGLNYVIMRPPRLLDELPENVRKNKVLSMSQVWDPLKSVKAPKNATKEEKQLKGNGILRSDCARVLADLAVKKEVASKVEKCTFNLWSGPQEAVALNNGSKLDYNVLRSDTSQDLKRFHGVSHDRPYWLVMGVLGASLAALTRLAFPQNTAKMYGYLTKKQ